MTELAISSSPHGGWTVVSVAGDIDESTAPELRVFLSGLVEEGASSLLLDLERVEFLDSSAFDVLRHAQHEVAGSGGEIQILADASPVATIFRTTGLDRTFTVVSEMPTP